MDYEQEMKSGLNVPSLWMVYIHVWYLFHMSKVTPECMPPTRGDFGHGPFFILKGSLNIRSIHMGLLYLCDYYTTPKIEIVFFRSGWVPKVWPLILTTCFLCPSKEGTKSVQGKKICAKLIVIYNVHTLP